MRNARAATSGARLRLSLLNRVTLPSGSAPACVVWPAGTGLVTRNWIGSPARPPRPDSSRSPSGFLCPSSATASGFLRPSPGGVRMRQSVSTASKRMVDDAVNSRHPEYHVVLRLTFRWSTRTGWTFRASQSVDKPRVVIEIGETGPAACELTLIHELAAAWADYADRTGAGASMVLAALARAVA